MEAPLQVRRAIALLWVALALSIVETVLNLTSMYDEGPGFAVTMLLLFGVTFGVNAVLIFFASRQRRWARLLLLVATLFGLGLYLYWLPEMDAGPWWHSIGNIATSAMDIVALFMLYLGAGATWYSKRSVA